MTHCHQLLDDRALAMDRLIAGRLRSHPELVHKARATLARWLECADVSVRPALEEWNALLCGPQQTLIEVLEGTDDRAKRLRQSSPFCGILKPAERT
jgi:hypothetical protein